MNIYQDESGCLGFNSGSSKYFVVALLCPKNSKHVSNVIRKFKGRLIKDGWPKSIEIKAHNLFVAKTDDRITDIYKYKQTPEQPIFTILNSLAKCEIEIDAIVVLKEKIHANLRPLPNSILLNYFAGRVLVDRIIVYDDVHLFVDETSKQTHNLQHFDGYIQTGVFLTKKKYFPFEIIHGNSNVIYGISATDFISWAIFRKYEFKDSRFFDVIKSKIVTFKSYYFRK
ncbi:MAG: DUF3800 domain-containing protein [Thermodesulfobacteriota bacterium]